MTHAENELYLYIINTGRIYRSFTCPVIAYLQRKHAKGLYDSEQAVKAYAKVAKVAADNYKREFGGTFSTKERSNVAAELEKYYLEQVQEAKQVAGSISEVKAKNKAAGYHFFDAETMSFFNSKVCTGLLRGRFFVTSDVNPAGVKRYTVREAKEDGNVETVGEFHIFKTLESAKTYIKNMV